MLSVREVCKDYAGKSALSQVSFDLMQGEIVALLGANGSGKTTTVQSICGLVKFEQGDILFERESILGNSRYLQHVGAVLDGSRNTNWRLTASQNAQYFARLHGVSSRQSGATIKELQHKLGLEPYQGQEVMKLSTGNKQKAALLCALAHQPKLVLMDEPTLGLDLNTVAELQDIIRSQARNEGQGFLVTSHDLSFIDRICSHVVVLDQGQVVFNGSLVDLKKKMFSFELRLQLKPAHIPDVLLAVSEKCRGKFDSQHNKDGLSIKYDSVGQVLPLLGWLDSQVWQPDTLHIEELGIEKAYRSLTQQESHP